MFMVPIITSCATFRSSFVAAAITCLALGATESFSAPPGARLLMANMDATDPLSDSEASISVLGDKAYIAALYNQDRQAGLFTSDGTAAGTQMLCKTYQTGAIVGTAWTTPSGVCFWDYPGNGPWELMRTDGSTSE